MDDRTERTDDVVSRRAETGLVAGEGTD